MIGGLRTTSRYLLAGASVIGLLAIGAPEAKAQNMQEIQAQIDQMQATIKALQKQVQDAKAQASAAQTTADSAKGSDLDLKVKWKGAPELSSGDGKFKMKVRGRLEVDYNHANQDTAITSFPDVSATELRRARLGVEGIIWYDVKYILEVDFANDQVVTKDAYLQYQGVKIGDTPLIFRAGNTRTPNSFEQLTADTYVDTMERAAFTDAFDVNRQIGFLTAYWSDHFGLAAGIFGDRTPSTSSAPLFAGFIGDEDLTFAARATVAPIHRELNGVNQVLHFGASVRTRDVGDDQPFLQYRARGADLHMTNFAVNTGRISDGDTFWGLEAAGLWGPFSLQGEYAHTDVELPGGSTIRSNSSSFLPTAPNPFIGVPDPEYTGWYVEGSWFFGGHKTYENEGKWGRPKIDNPMRWAEHSGWGALQLVGKYDVIDLSDTGNNVLLNGSAVPVLTNPFFVGACATTQLFPGANTIPTGINAAKVAQCGDMKTWIIGVNWYLNDYTRLMFNYTQSDLSGYPVTPISGTTSPDGLKAGFDGATIRGFGMRAQVDW